MGSQHSSKRQQQHKAASLQITNQKRKKKIIRFEINYKKKKEQELAHEGAHTFPQENQVLSWAAASVLVVVLHNTEAMPLLEVALDKNLHHYTELRIYENLCIKFTRNFKTISQMIWYLEQDRDRRTCSQSFWKIKHQRTEFMEDKKLQVLD